MSSSASIINLTLDGSADFDQAFTDQEKMFIFAMMGRMRCNIESDYRPVLEESFSVGKPGTGKSAISECCISDMFEQ